MAKTKTVVQHFKEVPPGTYASVLDVGKGKIVMADLSRLFGDRPSYIPKETDNNEVMYREGQRSVERYIRRRIAESLTKPPTDAATTEGT